MAMKKKDLIQYISSVTEDDVNEWSSNNHTLMVDGSHTIGNITVSLSLIFDKFSNVKAVHNQL